MIRAQSLLQVVDNSGAKLVKCVKVKNKGGKSYANLGDTVLVAVQSLRPRYGRRVRLKMNKSEVHHGVIVQTRRFFRNIAGFGWIFQSNAVALVSPKGKPLGTRIGSTLPGRLRNLKRSKLAAMARGIV